MPESIFSHGPVPVTRVLKAYEQVADQLRDLIISGRVSAGERLPNEASLAEQFGVSRATVREALRVLSTQNLIRTVKGTAGGSYVTLPTVDHISQFMQANLSLLSSSNDVTLAEFLEAREYLEVPAARLAAERRTDEDLLELTAAIPAEPLELTVGEQFKHNKRWHSAVVDSCKNSLLSIAVQPVFVVLQRNLQRSALSNNVHKAINDDHHRITEAISAGDANRAEAEMRTHLAFLRPFYENIWRQSQDDEQLRVAIDDPSGGEEAQNGAPSDATSGADSSESRTPSLE